MLDVVLDVGILTRRGVGHIGLLGGARHELSDRLLDDLAHLAHLAHLAVDDLGPVRGRRHHSVTRVVLAPPRLTGHHHLLPGLRVPHARDLAPGVLGVLLLLVSLLDHPLVLDPHRPARHRPLDLTWPHLNVSDRLRLDRALWSELDWLEDSVDRDPGLVSPRPGLDPVPHRLLHPRLARPHPLLHPPDDAVPLARLPGAADDDWPRLASGVDGLLLDNVGHLFLRLGLSAHHLDAGVTRLDHHLASPRGLLPHSGPLSDLTSLQPRPRPRPRGHVVLLLGPGLLLTRLHHHPGLGRGRGVRLGVGRRHGLASHWRPGGGVRLACDDLVRVGSSHPVLRVLLRLLLVIIVMLLRMRRLGRVLLDLVVRGLRVRNIVLIMLVVVGMVAHVMAVLLAVLLRLQVNLLVVLLLLWLRLRMLRGELDHSHGLHVRHIGLVLWPLWRRRMGARLLVVRGPGVPPALVLLAVVLQGGVVVVRLVSSAPTSPVMVATCWVTSSSLVLRLGLLIASAGLRPLWLGVARGHHTLLRYGLGHGHRCRGLGRAIHGTRRA